MRYDEFQIRARQCGKDYSRVYNRVDEFIGLLDQRVMELGSAVGPGFYDIVLNDRLFTPGGLDLVFVRTSSVDKAYVKYTISMNEIFLTKGINLSYMINNIANHIIGQFVSDYRKGIDKRLGEAHDKWTKELNSKHGDPKLRGLDLTIAILDEWNEN